MLLLLCTEGKQLGECDDIAFVYRGEQKEESDGNA